MEIIKISYQDIIYLHSKQIYKKLKLWLYYLIKIQYLFAKEYSIIDIHWMYLKYGTVIDITTVYAWVFL